MGRTLSRLSSDRPVGAPKRAQVRKLIYKSSEGCWRARRLMSPRLGRCLRTRTVDRVKTSPVSIDRRPGWIYSVENANRGEPTTSGQSASNRRHSNSRPLANCPLYGTPNHVRSALARYANNLNVVLARLDSGCVSMSGPSQPIADQRTCLLILGMHRSGTSAITRILNLMGAELPKQLLGALPGNEAGHWEPERLVLLHDQMLAEAGSSWRDLRPLDLARLSADRLAYYKSMIQSIIQDEFGNAFIFALKDPRICRFIPIYRAILSDLGVRTQPIIIVRNPLEVSASLSARDKMSNTHGLLLWLRHCLDIEKHTRDMSWVFVGYDRVVNDIHDVIARLHELLGYLPLSFHPSDITNLVLPSIRHDLRHQISSSDDVDQCALTKTWIKEAYRAFQALSTGEGEESAITCLDTISQEFNNFSSLLAQLADDVDILRIKEQQLEENIHILQDNICHSQYTIEQLHGQIQWNAEQHARALQWNAEHMPRYYNGTPSNTPAKYNGILNGTLKNCSGTPTSMSASCSETPSSMLGKYTRTPNGMPANSRGCSGVTTISGCRLN